jgi:hypothetical protein
MPQCAFCDHTGKLSSEHIVSEWLSKLFPGPIRAKYGEGGIVIKEFTTNAMDYKAKVVCEQCNNTWMSDIEEQHAKPVLTPLVTGQRGILIDKRAQNHWLCLRSRPLSFSIKQTGMTRLFSIVTSGMHFGGVIGFLRLFRCGCVDMPDTVLRGAL